ncbi:hypothetical protein UFOVP806_14 [uncultured Caudovirales phage]|uniref:Uncharacterized protein n=1 Tax=uncultured Caudovirales phage TaxID=2100421 RepID=A0A6J5NUJ8_9CAUD|nr:hypothetical protein UFOVP806_14 [uncultured Caudovirales phage]
MSLDQFIATLEMIARMQGGNILVEVDGVTDFTVKYEAWRASSAPMLTKPRVKISTKKNQSHD